MSAQLIASIASIELPRGLWEDLVQILSEGVTSPQSTVSSKKAALETIKIISQDMVRLLFCCCCFPQRSLAQPVAQLKPYTNSILTALVAGARSEEPNPDIRRAAMGAFVGAISMFSDNFSTERERIYIMQVIYQATQCQDSGVKLLAFECLVKIMSYFYDQMGSYMDSSLIAVRAYFVGSSVRTAHFSFFRACFPPPSSRSRP